MVENQIVCSRLEQRSVMKFLLAEKCKQCEIYRRKWDVYKEAWFCQENVYKWTKHGRASTSLSQKGSS